MNKLIAIAVVLLSAFGSIAQTGMGTESTTIHVSQAGERKIITPTKKSQLPEIIQDSLVSPPKEGYKVVPKQVEVNFEPEEIKPARLKVSEPLEKLYRGYVKAGVGNYLMPLGELYYTSSRSRENNWGLGIKHFSMNQNLQEGNLGFSRFSENTAHADYKHFLKSHSLKFDLDYARNVVHYYGLDTTGKDEFYQDERNIRTIYNLIDFGTTLESFYKDSAKLNHQIDLNYYHLHGNQDNRENNLFMQAHLKKYFGKELGLLDFDLDYNNYKTRLLGSIDSVGKPSLLVPEQIGTFNGAILRFSPAIETTRKKLRVKVGASLQIDTDGDKTVRVFPNIEAKYNLFNNIFIPYIGASGYTSRNSFKTLSQENPFLLSDFTPRNTSETYRIYGGFRGSVSSKVSFNVQVAQSRFENMAFFVNDSVKSLGNRFDVVYDRADRLQIAGQVSYHDGERIKVYLRGAFNTYKLKDQAEAWHRPALEVTMGGAYDLADKLIAKVDLFFIGNRPIRTIDEEKTANTGATVYQTLPAIFDANIGAEYRYTDRLSVFFNVNNLTTKKYQKWSQFPAQSINVLGGVTYRF